MYIICLVAMTTLTMVSMYFLYKANCLVKKLQQEYQQMCDNYADKCQHAAHLWDMYCQEVPAEAIVIPDYNADEVMDLERLYKLVDPR